MDHSEPVLNLAASAAVDLHLHTTFSDGRWTLAPLLDHLVHAHFALAAVTDHDCMDQLDTVQQMARERNLPVLAAVEMTTTWRDEMVDLLCYGFDPTYGALRSLARDVMRRQQENTLGVFAGLRQQGIDLPDQALAFALAQPSSQQPHVLAALLREHGYGLGDPSAGRLVLSAGCAFAMSEPAAVVEAAHADGGVCLLAHPGRDDGFVTFDAALLDQFRREAAIDGLEVYYPRHTPEQIEMFRAYARRHGLLVSAGSDSHGPDKPPIPYRAEQVHDLLARLGVVVG